MSELVLLHHNEPMTTSLAIAACTENEHESVILLVRKFINELEEFGDVNFQTAKPGNSRFEIGNKVFEIENCRSEKGRQTEFAFLNEQQSTLLVTFMRNSETVVRFKVALVKAFYEMRDRLRADSIPAAPQFATSNLSHGADLAVTADRTFRSFMRAARTAGLRMPEALRIANQQTRDRTGMDMLSELGVSENQVTVPDYDPYGVAEFVQLWLDGELPVPATHCRSSDLYEAYALWRREGAASINVFGGWILRAGSRLSKRMVWIRGDKASERKNARGIILPWLDKYGPDRALRLAEEFDRFTSALQEWKRDDAMNPSNREEA